MKSKIVLILGICIMLLSSLVVVIANGAGPNYMGFTEPVKHVLVGTTFYSYIYGDISSEIDTIAVDNLTYLPAGIITNNLLSVALSKGTIFNDDYTLIFSRATTVNDAEGWAKSWKWGIDAPGSTPRVNNTNATAFNTKWNTVGCGIVTLTITEGGTAANGLDPGTTKYTQTVYVHPLAITGFTATKHNSTQIDLAWTKHTGDDKTLIRWRSDHAPINVTDGTLLYNNTGSSTTQTGLSPGTTRYYSTWGWNNTGTIYSYTYVSANAQTNRIPTYGTPSPTNGSTGQNLALTWSIAINDPDGDTFSWTIQCNNSQSNSGSGANGTKSLSLTGLSYSKTYTVWVNTSDASDTTRAWFTFSTKANTAPTQGTPSPTNGSTGEPLALTWSIALTDPDDTITWTIQCSNSQQTSGTNTASGTKSLALTGLDRLTWYTIWVNLTDGTAWSRKWYNFQTMDNRAPTPSNPIPSNVSSDVEPDIGYLRVRVTDPDGDALNVSFYWGNGTLIGTKNSVVSGQLAQLAIPTLDENTEYDWYVNVSDGYGGYTRGPTSGNYTFTTGTFPTGGTTGGEQGKNKVLFLIMFNELPVSGAIITISKGTSVQSTGIQVSAATTGADGIYQFSLPNGKYVVTVNAPGKTLYQKAISVQGDASYVLNLNAAAVSAGPGATVYVIVAIFAVLILAGFLFATGRIGTGKKY